MEDSKEHQQIVLTPKRKTANSTTLLMERKKRTVEDVTNFKTVYHALGSGKNAGIVVNKSFCVDNDVTKTEDSDSKLEFRVFLINGCTKKITQEKRTLNFWFENGTQVDRPSVAQNFFKLLIKPVDFPRDYVGFIKKIMLLMGNNCFSTISKMEVVLVQEKVMEKMPSRNDAVRVNSSSELDEENVLRSIEEAYPNSLTFDDLSCQFGHDVTLSSKRIVNQLVQKKLVKFVGGITGMPSNSDEGNTIVEGVAFRRVHANEADVTVVRQMSFVSGAEQPSIAIITTHYHEKLAVDAFLTNKRTFVRYATNGQANVYTIGNMGEYRVVTTKLPIGNSQHALISGSTTTRLLGTFQGVEYVFVVGVGGAVPHYTDYYRHVRLGDVVLSVTSSDNNTKDRSIYRYCESAILDHRNETSIFNDSVSFETKCWQPNSSDLFQSLATNFAQNISPTFRHYYESALADLEADNDLVADHPGITWQRPDPASDRLFMNVGSSGNNDVVEVDHPLPPHSSISRSSDLPRIHCGLVASCSPSVAANDEMRQSFCSRFGVLCLDSFGTDGVIDSICGNRKDNWILIRSAADYYDGTTYDNEWKPHAALIAATILRCMIDELPPL